jgi:hypothetical protein
VAERGDEAKPAMRDMSAVRLAVATAVPGLVATIGLHGSASTWVFNVARELMIDAAGEYRVVSCYADEPAHLPAETARIAKCLVIKSHPGSVALDAWLKAKRARTFLSVRDPRDACISMSQRFRVPLNRTVTWLAQDCAQMLRLADEGYALLRYEEGFFDDPASVGVIASGLGLAVAPALADTIFQRYQTDAVRAYAKRLGKLSPERITMVGGFMMDRVTQILGPHIGDGIIGKWWDLSPKTQVELTHEFGPFLDRFNYPR